MGKSVTVVQLVLSVMLAGIVFNANAGAASEPLAESQQLFFSQFRYAVQAHDTSQLIRLTHSKSLDCVSDEDREFYYGKILDGLVRVLGKRQIVHKVSMKMFAQGELAISKDLPSGEQVNWPVEPEVQLIIQYDRQGREAVASLYLAKDGDDWKWLHICIKEQVKQGGPELQPDFSKNFFETQDK